ncbi:hypothetical protein D3C77_533720 [compost metagenome]
MGEYQKSLGNIISMLDPASRRPNASVGAAAKSQRRPRILMKYTNPHDNTVVESKGGNHKTLKLWSEQYGKEEVKSWGKPA